MIGAHGALGKSAPAAADLQHIGAHLVELAQDAVIFVLLCIVERVGVLIERRGIGHALVKPQRIEIVADIVMRLDVARRSRDRIAPHQRIVDHKAEPVEEIAVGEILQMVDIEQEQADQCLDIVGLPAARDIFLAEPDIAARHDPAQHVPVMDLEMGAGAGPFAARDRDFAIGRDEFEPSGFQPRKRLAPAFLHKGRRNQSHPFPPENGKSITAAAPG